MDAGKKIEGGFRTKSEQEVGKRLAHLFSSYSDDIETKLDNFPKYVRRQKITRLLAQYEIFKKVIEIKGSIIECGVYRGSTLMAWAQLSSILEPVNLTRRIYGFDTFSGFPQPVVKDKGKLGQVNAGGLCADSYEELKMLIDVYDSNRFLGHIPKVELIKGDATVTIPEFIKNNQHLLVSLLFLDFDLYEPTKVAIQNFIPRMPKGSIIAFDELDNPLWPGESLAVKETVGIDQLEIRRVEFDPYIGYAVIQ